jgi:hypothetical protein
MSMSMAPMRRAMSPVPTTPTMSMSMTATTTACPIKLSIQGLRSLAVPRDNLADGADLGPLVVQVIQLGHERVGMGDDAVGIADQVPRLVVHARRGLFQAMFERGHARLDLAQDPVKVSCQGLERVVVQHQHTL